MIIRNNASTAKSTLAPRRLIYALALVALAGCTTSMSSLIEPNRIDYKSASKAPANTLDVPPDLTQLQRENRYAIPDNNKGTATASSYNLQQGTLPASPAKAVIAPNVVDDIHVERAGNQRWLVTKQSPEVLWPQIKDFWQESGFLINVELPEAGVMETDWAENRSKIPHDFIRDTLGKLIDSVYDTGERDKFRTRLERTPDGNTEIYISHRGAEEVLTGSDKTSSIWTPRPSDPNLEYEFLARLMTRLGVDEVHAKAAVANAVSEQPHAKFVKSAGSAYVETDDGFDRAWRRVGLALDRVGFTVEDRDRSQGVYFVRYVDQDSDAATKKEKGFFSNLFSFGSKSDKEKSALRYRVSVKETGAFSRITVLNNDGHADTSAVADKILGLLNDQLK